MLQRNYTYCEKSKKIQKMQKNFKIVLKVMFRYVIMIVRNDVSRRFSALNGVGGVFCSRNRERRMML